jgi:tetratricopeptide (TPR) repeat protein
MNYVVLHIDIEFIVGAVCTDNVNAYPITNGNDDLLWLYFYNDPHSNRITFGKNNCDNAKREVINYYGNFFQIITDGHTTFKRGEFQKDAIELLQYSDLLKTIKDKYADVTRESTENIHTLITFSLSISDLAKQKTVEYLKSQGFLIDSYTIPLAELVAYYPYSKKDFLPANGSTILLLVATNATLHIMKLVFSDNYFMLDGAVQKYEGMGIDPRKRALVGYVINQINISVGALNTNEIPAEIEKKAFKADEWLKKIDAKGKNDNSPVRITDNLSPMPSSMRDVLVKKSDIETFTNDFVNLLMDYFNAYKSDNVSGDIAGIFLLGDCFNNSLVKQRFNNLFRDDDERKKKLFAYTNKDIQSILSVYPKIDFKRYINEEQRSKAKAEAEEKKMAEQRAIDAAKEAEAKAEMAKIIAAKQAEENRKEAQNHYGRAVEFEKEGKLQDALANVENAVALDKNNTEYARFKELLQRKIKELHYKTEKYKSWLKDAENYEQTGQLNLALKAYKNAQQIFDSSELRKKIVLTDHQIETEQQYKEAVNKADIFFKVQDFDNALEQYAEALSIRAGDSHCSDQIAKINAIIQQTLNQEKAEKIVAEADKLFEKALWEDAKAKYEEAISLYSNNKSISDKIQQCAAKIKAQADQFADLLFEAKLAEKKNKWQEALSYLEQAEKIYPNHAELIEYFKKVRNAMKLDFGEAITTTTDASTEKNHSINNDDWEFATKAKAKAKSNPKQDHFLKSNSNSQQSNSDDDFLGIAQNKKSPVKTSAPDDDDFLGVSKEKKSDHMAKQKKVDFDNW